jgi:hypothetical protein
MTTHTDRAKAMRALGFHSNWTYEDLNTDFGEGQREMVDRMATALAAERAQAVQPFLDLADELLRVAQDSDGITAVVYRQNADRIRAVAHP